jgi:hypothetical protein
MTLTPRLTRKSGRKRSATPVVLDTDTSDEEYRVSVQVARRRSFNSSRARVATLRAPAGKHRQLHRTSRRCSNVRSVKR